MQVGLYPVEVCYNARQENTIQYSTVERVVIEIHLQSPINYVLHYAEIHDTLTW
jgi:hypothetical protein